MATAFTQQQHHQWMQLALQQAKLAEQAGDVPVGAVVVDANGTLLTQAHNVREANNDPCGHAELLAIRHAAQQLGQWRLTHCTLIVTLDVCQCYCSGQGGHGNSRRRRPTTRRPWRQVRCAHPNPRRQYQHYRCY